MTDIAPPIIESPGEVSPELEAWFNAVLRIGDDVGQMAASSRQRNRRVMLPMVPVYGNAYVANNGTAVVDMGTPVAGKLWEIRGLAIVDASNPGGVTGGGVNVAVSATGAAGAAGSVALPAGAQVTGYDVDFQAPAAAVSTNVTVTNLSTANGSSGTLNASMTIPTTGLVNLPRAFPNPLNPATAAAQPTLNVPIIASGPAYSMTIYGTTAVTGATPGSGFWYTGIPSVYGPQNARWTIPGLPTIDTKGGQHITVPHGEHLFAVLTGCTPGHQIVARADIIEDIPGRANAVQAL